MLILKLVIGVTFVANILQNHIVECRYMPVQSSLAPIYSDSENIVIPRKSLQYLDYDHNQRQMLPQSMQRMPETVPRMFEPVQRMRQPVQRRPQSVQMMPQSVQMMPQSVPRMTQSFQMMPEAVQRMSEPFHMMPEIMPPPSQLNPEETISYMDFLKGFCEEMDVLVEAMEDTLPNPPQLPPSQTPESPGMMLLSQYESPDQQPLGQSPQNVGPGGGPPRNPDYCM